MSDSQTRTADFDSTSPESSVAVIGQTSSESDPVSWPSPTRAWWALAVFAVTAILSYTDRNVLSILVDPIRADLNLSDVQVSLLQGFAFAIMYVFAGIPFGRLADTLPRKWVIVVGILAWSAATLVCGISYSFGALFIARMAVGVGEAALSPAAMSMISDYFPPARRGVAISVFMAGIMVGSGSAIAFGGGLLELTERGVFSSWPLVAELPSWRTVLVMLAFPGIAVACLLFTVREPMRRNRTGQAFTRSMPLKSVVKFFVDNRACLAPIYVAVAVLSIAEFSMLAWMPSLLSRKFGYPAGTIGATLGTAAMMAGLAGVLSGGLLNDWLLKRSGNRAPIGCALFLSIACVAGTGVGFAPTAAHAIALFTLFFALSKAAEAIGVVTIQRIVPSDARGIGIALVSFGNILLGMGFGTWLTAYLTQDVYQDSTAVGISLTTVTMPAAILVCFLFWRAHGAVGRHSYSASTSSA